MPIACALAPHHTLPLPALVHAENAYLHSAHQEREDDNQHYGPARHERAFPSLPLSAFQSSLLPLLLNPSVGRRTVPFVGFPKIPQKNTQHFRISLLRIIGTDFVLGPAVINTHTFSDIGLHKLKSDLDTRLLRRDGLRPVRVGRGRREDTSACARVAIPGRQGAQLR